MPDQARTSGPFALHLDVTQLGFLLGTWTGQGEGAYRTIRPFRDTEESIFWPVGKPFIGYSQRTWKVDDGIPSHTESGYWRCPDPGRVELVVAHPNGQVEVAEGRVQSDGDHEGAVIELGLDGDSPDSNGQGRLVARPTDRRGRRCVDVQPRDGGGGYSSRFPPGGPSQADRPGDPGMNRERTTGQNAGPPGRVAGRRRQRRV